jgi:DNA-binding transcriptional MerR regulator
MWKIGELSAATGLTTRTLHHYHDIGLLAPSARTTAGYRLYSEEDIARLHRIVALRQLGLSLDEVRDCLDRPEYSLEHVLALRTERLRQEIAGKQELLERLERLSAHIRANEATADELILTIEAMNMFEKYYTPEQMEYLRKRREEVGDERIQEVQAEWPKLISEVKAEKDKGTPPSDPRMQELARRWKGLVEEFTGGDPGVAQSLNRMYQDEAGARQSAGFDPELMAYVGEAMKHGA